MTLSLAKTPPDAIVETTAVTLFSSVPSQSKFSPDCKVNTATTPELHTVAPFRKDVEIIFDAVPSINPPTDDSSKIELPQKTMYLSKFDERRYGDTTISYFVPVNNQA